MKGALEKSGVKPEQLDEAIIGHARQAGGGPNAARIVTVNAGIPDSVPAFAIQQACNSGMQAVMLAYKDIVLGDADVVLTGGMEHHSSVPYLLTQLRWGGARMGDVTVLDGQFKDGYHCGIERVHMGLLTDVLAEELGITREEQDQFALGSQQKAAKAKEGGFFAKTIVPLEDALRHFQERGLHDKARLLAHRKKPHLVLYQLGNHKDYHHGGKNASCPV